MLPNDEALLGALYEGPLEDPPWSTFLEALRARFGALTTTWIVRASDDAGPGLAVSRGERRFESAYRERFFASDPFVNLPEGEVVTLADLLPGAALRRTAFYRQLLAPAGVRQVMGVDLAAHGLAARLRISRGPRTPRFSRAERAVLAALVPHARRALRLYARTAHAESERDAYSDRLALGVLLLDARGRVVSRNAASERLERSGAGIDVRDGRPSAATPEDTRVLRNAIERALAAREPNAPALVEALQLRGRAGAAFGVLLRPLAREAASAGKPRPALALFFGDPATREEIPIDTLRGLFAFTAAEARLAAQLAAGASLDTAAAQLAIARNTARAHLRSIFEKTGVSRQAELVRLILRSVATLG